MLLLILSGYRLILLQVCVSKNFSAPFLVDSQSEFLTIWLCYNTASIPYEDKLIIFTCIYYILQSSQWSNNMGCTFVCYFYWLANYTTDNLQFILYLSASCEKILLNFIVFESIIHSQIFLILLVPYIPPCFPFSQCHI